MGDMRKLRESAKLVIDNFKGQTGLFEANDSSGASKFPTILPAKSGNKVVIFTETEKSIRVFARQIFTEKLLQNRSTILEKDLERKITEHEWQNLVLKEFAEPLDLIHMGWDLPDEHVFNSIISGLENIIQNYGKQEVSFGCILFSGKDASNNFQIGPVLFESRLDWLERKTKEKSFSKEINDYYKVEWDPESKNKNIIEKTGRRKADNLNGIHKNEIDSAIDDCPYVCSVSMKDLSTEATREKAFSVARLAIASLILLRPSNKYELRSMNILFDRRHTGENNVIFSTPNRKMISGYNRKRFTNGAHISKENWDDIMSNNADYFKVIEEILFYMIAPVIDNQRPKMINAFALALMWYGEGYWENNDLIAVIKYSALLDCLSGGGEKTSGYETRIKNMLKERLDVDEETEWADGQTIVDAVRQIYGPARSRSMHGYNPALANDWSKTRERAEWLARIAFQACVDYILMYPNCDEPLQLSQPEPE